MARKGYLNSEEIAVVFSCHELAFDVSCFVKEHQTVGFFSEEELESIHHAINLEGAQLVDVGRTIYSQDF